MYTICQMLHHPLQKDASLTDLRSLHPGRVNQGYIHWMRRISGQVGERIEPTLTARLF
jgi:hypothetical protein